MNFGIGKKGNAIIDGVTVVVLIVAFAICSVIGYMVSDNLNDDLQLDDTITTEAKDMNQGLHDKYSGLMDNLILMAFVLFIIFTVISAFMLDTHPIFFMVSVILLVAVLVVAALMANVYDDLMLDDDLAPYANEFTYTGWLMSHLLEVTIALVFIITIVLFIKFKQ